MYNCCNGGIMTERRKRKEIWRSASKMIYIFTEKKMYYCLFDILVLMEYLTFVIMHQESKDDLSLKAARIILPSGHNSLTLFTLKSWTSLNTEGLRQYKVKTKIRLSARTFDIKIITTNGHRMNGHCADGQPWSLEGLTAQMTLKH